jgi:hypothetical protein
VGVDNMSNLDFFFPQKNRKISQIYTRGEKKISRRNDKKICNLDEEAFEY